MRTKKYDEMFADLTWFALGEHFDIARKKLQEIGGTDPEVGHALRDDLMLLALRTIRDVEEKPSELAAQILHVVDVDFPMWFA